MTILYNFTRIILALSILASLVVPIVAMYRFEMSQWEVLWNTWIFIFYPIVLLAIGHSAIETIFKK